jgi:thiamine biosynthesis lipoprotein
MGTLAVIDAWGGDAGHALELARREFERLESLWSRFRPGSDVARLNAASGDWVDIAPETSALLRTAVALRAETGGAFDVTLGSGVLEEGDIRDDAARMQPVACIDLGGIGKGAAVPRVIDLLREHQVPAAMVNLGRSSIGVLGTPPGRDHWRVAIDMPVVPESAAHVIPATAFAGMSGGLLRPGRQQVLAFRGGYVSTSGASGGHTVEPSTGEPPASGIRSATVLCDDGARAEAWSTALLVLGVPGMALAEKADCAAVLVDEAGHIHSTTGLGHHESEEPCA